MTTDNYNKKDVYKKIGKNIQKIRKQKGWSQEEFAEKMGVSWSYIAKVECGILNMSVGKLIDFA